MHKIFRVFRSVKKGTSFPLSNTKLSKNINGRRLLNEIRDGCG
jgi:hypothetical protein